MELQRSSFSFYVFFLSLLLHVLPSFVCFLSGVSSPLRPSCFSADAFPDARFLSCVFDSLCLRLLCSILQGRRDGSTKDEPFAWQSREFLRKATVGKQCVFRVDYTVDALGGRAFGTVFLGDKENVALSLVSSGMARVRPASEGQQRSPFYDELMKAQEQAEAEGLGVHSTDPSTTQDSVRGIVSSDGFDSHGFLKKIGKGGTVSAIVEGVPSGSMLRVTLLPDIIPTAIMVAGVVCPSMNQRRAGTEGGPTTVINGAATASETSNTDAGDASKGPEPFAREARHMTELRCLAKEVRLILHGVSQHGMLVASVCHPTAGKISIDANTASDSDQGFDDLASALVRAGLGRAAEWSLELMTSGAFRLRELERSARQTRLGIWHNYVPPKTNTAKLSDKFKGTVFEIVSGDCIVVQDATSATERRVHLSSIRAPRPAVRDRPSEPWGSESKEFLRQRLIGKEVEVSLEYTRKVPVQPGSDETRMMSLGTVTISEKSKTGETKINNVAELLLIRGLAQTVRHRGDDERSEYYEDLVNAEDVAKKGKKGLWSSKEPPIPRVNDISIPGAGARARQHLPFLQRAGKMNGICETVLGGSRLKIYIPKEGVILAFSPSGVRCPGRNEPLNAEALAFTKARVLQRDVQVEVESIDKLGTFLGRLEIVKPAKGTAADLGASLLEAGLARLQGSGHFALRQELIEAQEKAKKVRRGIWELEDSKDEAVEKTDGNGVGKKESDERKMVEVVVTDVTDANRFYVQFCKEPRTAWLSDQLSSMSLDDEAPPVAQLKPGDSCIAKFALDGQWYRARIQSATGSEYKVFFIDYGNTECVKKSDVRAVPQSLSAVPPQAHLASLAFVRCPNLSDDYGLEAAQQLSKVVGGGKKLQGMIEKSFTGTDGPEMLLTLWSSSSDPGSVNGRTGGNVGYGQSVNSILVCEGLARVIERRDKNQRSERATILEELWSQEEEARARHIGLWRYGDPGDDDDEDDGGFPALRR